MTPQNCVLFIEKDREAVAAFFRAFETLAQIYAVQAVSSGAEAISYLKGIGRFSHRAEYPIPAVLVTGSTEGDFRAVEWLRNQPELEFIRVVALLDSEDEQLIGRAYEAGVNSCLVRTPDFTELRDILSVVGKYWIECNQVPGCV